MKIKQKLTSLGEFGKGNPQRVVCGPLQVNHTKHKILHTPPNVFEKLGYEGNHVVGIILLYDNE